MISLLSFLLLPLLGTINSNSFPEVLSEDEEKHYLDLWQKKDYEARNTLIEHNLRLVAHIVKKSENLQEKVSDGKYILSPLSGKAEICRVLGQYVLNGTYSVEIGNCENSNIGISVITNEVSVDCGFDNLDFYAKITSPPAVYQKCREKFFEKLLLTSALLPLKHKNHLPSRTLIRQKEAILDTL